MRHLGMRACLLALLFGSTPVAAQLLPLGLSEPLPLSGTPRDPALAGAVGGGAWLLYQQTVGELIRTRLVPLGREEPGPDDGFVVQDAPTFSPAVIARHGDAGSLVLWSRRAEPELSRIVARRVSPSGEPQGEEISISSDAAPTGRDFPALACNGDGRCVAAWVADFDTMVARRLDETGFPEGPEILVASVSVDLGEHLRSPAVAIAEDGRFVVLWQSWTVTGESSGSQPMMRLFDADGTALTTAFPLEDAGALAGNAVRAAWNDRQQLLVAWDAQSSDPFLELPTEGVRSRLFDALGNPLTEVLRLDRGFAPQVEWRPTDRRFVALWQVVQGNDAATQYLVRMQLFSEEGARQGTAATLAHSDAFGPIFDHVRLASDSVGRTWVAWQQNTGDVHATLSIHTVELRPGAPVCALPFQPNPPEAVLCGSLGPQGRYAVYGFFRGIDGGSEDAKPIQVTPDAVSFFFNNPANQEIYAKVVDGRVLNDHFWFFYGALSNQEYVLAVYDRATGLSRLYNNPARRLASLGDTSAFPEPEPGSAAALALDLLETQSWGEPSEEITSTGDCPLLPNTLCLSEEFTVELQATDFAGNPLPIRAVPQTSLSGYFTFVNPNNVELAVKILDGRAINGKWWVFYASLTNVEFTLTIRGANGQIVKQYQNPRRSFGSLADTGAF